MSASEEPSFEAFQNSEGETNDSFPVGDGDTMCLSTREFYGYNFLQWQTTRRNPTAYGMVVNSNSKGIQWTTKEHLKVLA